MHPKQVATETSPCFVSTNSLRRMRKRAQTVVKDNWLPRDISMRTKGMALPVKNSNGTLETTTRRGQKGSASAAAASAASRAARAAHASEAGGAAAALTAHVKAPPLDTSAGDALTAADALTTAADAAAHLPPHNLPSDQAPSECKGLAPPPEFAGTSGVGDGCSAPVDPSSDRTVAEEEGGAAVAAVPLPISQGPGPGQGPGPCLATAAAPDAKSSQEAKQAQAHAQAQVQAQQELKLQLPPPPPPDALEPVLIPNEDDKALVQQGASAPMS